MLDVAAVLDPPLVTIQSLRSIHSNTSDLIRKISISCQSLELIIKSYHFQQVFLKPILQIISVKNRQYCKTGQTITPILESII